MTRATVTTLLDWSTPQGQTMLEARASLYRRIREFMHDRGVLEVETPTLSASATPDPHLHSLHTTVTLPDGMQQSLFLHTSPEYGMKRLLADGSGPIYQITKVFRDEEAGRLHTPEFSMLEWYRPGFNDQRLMDEIAELLQWLNIAGPHRLAYADLFLRETGLHPHTCTTGELFSLAASLGYASNTASRADLLDFTFNHLVESRMSSGESYLVYDFPACQAALARLRGGNNIVVAGRFELFINGMEIANGFHELNDSSEQRERFNRENRVREQNGRAPMPLDEDFLAALDSMPDCSGVAVGLDRLLMCLTGAGSINDVLSLTVPAGK